MNGLEATYRRSLRWYPKRWRASNEDAVIGTLLDQADEEKRTTPSRGELADLRSNALLTRLGPLGRIPTPIRDRAVALGYGLGAGIAIAALIAMPFRTAALPPVLLPYLTIVGPYVGYSFIFYGVWILSLLAAVLGWKWAARALAMAAIAVSIVLRVAFGQVNTGAPTTTTVIFVGMLALLSFAGNPFRTRQGRLWVVVSALSWAAFIGVTLWYQVATKGGQAGGADWFIGPLWLWLEFIVPFALILAFILRSVAHSAWWGAIVIVLIPCVAFVIFGWAPRSDETVDRATLVGITIALICAVYFAVLLFRQRFRMTRV